MGRFFVFVLALLAFVFIIIFLISEAKVANAATPTPIPVAQLVSVTPSASATATEYVIVVTNPVTLSPTIASTATQVPSSTPFPTITPSATPREVTATPQVITAPPSATQGPRVVHSQYLDEWLGALEGKTFGTIRTTLERHQGAPCPAEYPAVVDLLVVRPTQWPMVVIVCRPNRQNVLSLFGFLILNQDGTSMRFEFGKEPDKEYAFYLTNGELIVVRKDQGAGYPSTTFQQIVVIQFPGDVAPPRHTQ